MKVPSGIRRDMVTTNGSDKDSCAGMLRAEEKEVVTSQQVRNNFAAEISKN